MSLSLHAWHYPRAMQQVMRDHRLYGAGLEAHVHRRLRTVLISAYRTVPYYRELMRGVGYDPVQDYGGPGDLAWLPITTKEDLKQRGVQGFVRQGTDLSKCLSDTTSGSTGIPLRVYQDPYERAVQIGKWLRVLLVNGYSMRDGVMTFAHPTKMDRGRSILQRFGLLRRRAVSYQQGAGPMVDALMDYQPDVLYGDRSFLDIVALELGRRGIEIRHLKLLIGTGEVIPEGSRRLYRRHFGVEMVESYGSVEMGVMAHETPDRDGLHLCSDLTYFEFLDDSGQAVPDGEPGRVVVTDLTGRLMPFIRYDQGDLAICALSGAGNQADPRRLAEIVGRQDDLAVLPDGTLCTRPQLVARIRKYDGIVQFRFVQKARDHFTILVVADSTYLEGIRAELLNWLRATFPPEVRFEIIHVDQIEPDAGGKIRSLVSEVER